MNKTRLTLTTTPFLLGLALAIAPAPAHGACNSNDQFEVNGVKYKEGKDKDSQANCYPNDVHAALHKNDPTLGMPALHIVLRYDYEKNKRNFKNGVVLNLYGTEPGTYTEGYEKGKGNILFKHQGVMCASTGSGKVTITQVSNVGEPIQGTFETSSLVSGSPKKAKCPASLKGSFKITRLADGG